LGNQTPHPRDIDEPLAIRVTSRVVLHQREVLRHVERQVVLDGVSAATVSNLTPRIWGVKLFNEINVLPKLTALDAILNPVREIAPDAESPRCRSRALMICVSSPPRSRSNRTGQRIVQCPTIAQAAMNNR
jgi:hypothetical protein